MNETRVPDPSQYIVKNITKPLRF